MGPRNRVSIEAAAALLVVPTLLLAQQAQAPEPAFRSRTDLVTVDVSALDQHERPVETLRPEDLVVLVDGAPRRVAALARFVAAGSPASLPAAIGLPMPVVVDELRVGRLSVTVDRAAHAGVG